MYFRLHVDLVFTLGRKCTLYARFIQLHFIAQYALEGTDKTTPYNLVCTVGMLQITL